MQFNLSISPLQTEFMARPGATFTQAYQITNNSQNTISLTTSIESWQPQGTDGSVQYLTQPITGFVFGLNNADLKLGQNFNLRPGESRQLVLKVKLDPDTPLKDSYFTFFVNKIPSGIDSDTGAAVSGRIGSHLLISTSAQENPQVTAKISDFKSTPQIKDIFFTPIQFNALIDNTSNYFFHTFGKISINKNGQTQKELNLQPNNVLAHHSRSILCSESSLCSIHPPFWPGAYTATLSLDASASAASASTTFYVFPISPLIFAIFIGLIILLLRRPRRH